MLIMLVGAALALDATPCPTIQPRPQSCSVDAPQTFSLLADPWRIAANLSDADDAFAASYLQKNLSAIVHLPIVDLNASSWSHVIAIERGGNGTAVEAARPQRRSIPENARLWADAVRTSRARYGAQSTAKGLLCTNWGGGRIERNVPIVAELSWNLYQ